MTNVPPLVLRASKLAGFGQGSGMLGLPGDFTPPSRFIRAVAFSQSAIPVATAEEGVLQAFHLLNQFDIPKGAVGAWSRASRSPITRCGNGSASDLTNLRYYFRTFQNSRIRMVDLKKVDLDAADIKTITMAGKEPIEDVSSQAK